MSELAMKTYHKTPVLRSKEKDKKDVLFFFIHLMTSGLNFPIKRRCLALKGISLIREALEMDATHVSAEFETFRKKNSRHNSNPLYVTQTIL